MKYLKYLFIIAFAFLIFSADVSAEEFDYPDFHELMGLTYEEFLDSLDEYGCFTHYFNQPFSVVNPNFVKDEEILLSHGISWVYDCPYDYMDGSGTISFGELKTWGQTPISITLTLYNNGAPLFENGGQLTFQMYVYAGKCTYTVYRTDGSEVSYAFVTQLPNGEPIYPWVEFNNSDCDISKIVFKYEYYVPQSTGGGLMGVGICDYGYLVDGAEPEPEPEPEFPIVSAGGNPGDALQYLTQFVVDMVNVFFVLELFTGITVGNFIIACMLLSIVFSFFFSRLIK